MATIRNHPLLRYFLAALTPLLIWLWMTTGSLDANTKSFDKIEPMHLGDQEVNSIFYLKIQKTGSTTLQSVLSRYALRHDLRVATYRRSPVYRPDTAAILENLTPDFVVGESPRYNLILDESYFHPGTIDKVFQPPVVYLTMLRHPMSWLESILHFHKATFSLGLDRKAVAASLVQRLDEAEWYRKHEQDVAEYRHVYTKAFMLDPSGGNVTQHISRLADRFLVGLTERYDESLILLRRTLGWGFRELLYSRMRQQSYPRSPPDPAVYTRLCAWNPYDCLLYETFRKTFSARVAAQGQDFQQEVAHFKDVQESVSDFCTLVYIEIKEGDPIRASLGITIEASAWHGRFMVTELDCALGRLAPWTYRPLFYYKQNPSSNCSKKCPTMYNKSYLRAEKQQICHRLCGGGPSAFSKILSHKHAYFWDNSNSMCGNTKVC